VLTAIEDGDLRAGPRRHVGKLEGDVTAPEEKDSRRQGIQFHELVAGRHVLVAVEIERGGLGTGSLSY
jgi:hypothetical protein